jgi:hypothetical protein
MSFLEELRLASQTGSYSRDYPFLSVWEWNEFRQLFSFMYKMFVLNATVALRQNRTCSSNFASLFLTFGRQLQKLTDQKT